MPALSSSAISWIEYDWWLLTLRITFRGGRSYTLQGVPAYHYEGLLHASSAGRYFNLYLKGKY